MPDHLIYHLDGTPRTTPVVTGPRPLTGRFTHYVTLRIRARLFDGARGVEGFLDPIAHVPAYWLEKAGVRSLHVHHAGLPKVNAKSQVIDEQGTTWEVVGAPVQHPGKLVLLLQRLPDSQS